MPNKDENIDSDGVFHTEPIPSEELWRYTLERDVHSETDIKDYVEGQASDEKVEHVEKVKEEIILGEKYEVWDVTTDKNHWWVLTNLTNLYPQSYFQSLDYTLSFHIGLMMRLRNRSNDIDTREPNPFDDVLRRLEQARVRHFQAVEAEEFQAVGMQLRESLISLIAGLRRRLKLTLEGKQPQDSNFVDWIEIIANELCPGRSNKEIRSYLKNTAKNTWQLVNWLTHDRNANRSTSLVSLNASDDIIDNLVIMLQRNRTDLVDQCPRCNSRQVRTHFDISIEPDGDYYLSCGVCDWTNHPEYDA